MTLPLHLAIIQPPGYVHSLGFLDQARYFRYQFRRLGHEVTIAKNRLREDAVNFVFGAHLGFPSDWNDRHVCLFVNLEQLGQGGSRQSAAYLDLLRSHAVVEYDAANIPVYRSGATDVPLVNFLHAPYLAATAPVPLEDRPIDLLFFGSINDRRRRLFDRIEATGIQISMFDHPLYGPERDHFIRLSKAVLNCHFYDSARFEQSRAFSCLSLGTPVISERTADTRPPAAYEDAIFWFDAARPERVFADTFGQRDFFDVAQAKLAAFARADALADYASLLTFALDHARTWRARRPASVWRPTRINLGSGKDYRPGWLNIDILERAQPDLVLDLGQQQAWPLEAIGSRGARIELAEASIDHVYANNVLEHVPDLPCLMTNILGLLREGGEFEIEVPYEHAPTAWQDPTHLRALNEQSWQYYTGWFWYLGWFEHRFEVARFQWLDLKLAPCEQPQAAFMRVVLRKIPTTPHERTIARTMQANFGGLDSDDVDEPTDPSAPRPGAASAIDVPAARQADTTPAAADAAALLIAGS